MKGKQMHVEHEQQLAKPAHALPTEQDYELFREGQGVLPLCFLSQG